MTDHDAIAARVRLMSEVCECDTDYCRHAEAHDDAPDYDGISAAYLDLYDEVLRLRAERDALISMRDSLGNFWAKAEARAEKAERFIATADSEWKARAEKAERERDEALRRRTRAERVGEAVIEWASRQTAELITEYAKALERHDWKPHAELTYAIADALKEADDAE